MLVYGKLLSGLSISILRDACKVTMVFETKISQKEVAYSGVFIEVVFVRITND